MSNEIDDDDDGGPAFPQVSTSVQWSPSCERYYDDTESFGGMTLRDYFATHSVHPGAGEIASLMGVTYRNGGIWDDTGKIRHSGFDEWFSAFPLSERLDIFSRVKYAMADAMLRARKEKPL